jgi:hypothetical protein
MSHPESRFGDIEKNLSDLIDRVVDGELSPGQLRDAVARLDASPDGWRRCALAFIEERALGELLREADVRPTPLDRSTIRSRSSRVRRLALAASLIAMAFGAGWMGHGSMSREPLKSTEAIAPPVVAASWEEEPAISVSPSAPVDSPATGPSPMPDANYLASESVEIPFEEWLQELPPPISAHDEAVLEREGYRVEQRRDVVLGTLDDGRLAAVPIDEVEVKYVGHIPL